MGVKPFLYDIFLIIDSLVEEGWNDDSISLGKSASVEMHDNDEVAFEKSVKNQEMMMSVLDWAICLLVSLVNLPHRGKLFKTI